MMAVPEQGAAGRSTGDPAPRTVHVVVPNDIDDPLLPSGGNVYDRRLCAGLRDRGWRVFEHPVTGPWPRRTPASRRQLTTLLAGLAPGSVVIIDGLVGSAAADILEPQADRLQLVTLVHLPLGPSAVEAAVLGMSRAVMTTSRWTARWLCAEYGLDPRRVHAVPPGVEAFTASPGSPGGGRLLCVGAVSEVKGQDLLVEALGTIADLPWCCRFVGSTAIDPDLVVRLRGRCADLGIEDRVSWEGPLPAAALAEVYDLADLLVVPSRQETYGMAAAEALAHGVPVLAAETGGLPETLGRAADGGTPGMVVLREDPAEIATALRSWLADRTLRERLRRRARARSAQLPRWEHTVAVAEAVLNATTTALVADAARAPVAGAADGLARTS